MALSDFDYDLPAASIAQAPAATRDAARLLVIDRASATLADRRIAELPELLRSGDCLVVNDSRVIPARVLAEDAAGRPVDHEQPRGVAGRGGGLGDGLGGQVVVEVGERHEGKCTEQ